MGGVLGGMGRLALGAGAAGFGSLMRCAEAQTPPAASGSPPGAAELIYSGGPIVTVNDAQPSAEAVAVRGGRIMAVGTRAQVEATRGPGTRMVNLEGRTMLPGFVDPHGHVVMGGLQAVGANMLAAPDGEANDIAAVIRILREWVGRNEAAVRRYNLIFGFGYDDSQIREGRHPTRDDLDQVSTEVPVLIIHTSSHLAAANSKALEVAGITAATSDPVGGVFRRRAGTREPDGVMQENALIAAAGPLLGRLDEAAWLSMIQAGAAADYRGLQTAPTEATIEAVSRCFERNWQILMHANGDAAIDLMIAAVREATRRHGSGDRRPVMIHGQTLRADQVDPVRELGIFPSLFPMHTFDWGDWHRDSVLGPERAENISPTGWLMSRGMMFTSHHDAPVARPDSMRMLSATVTRRSRSGDIIGPHHRVPVATALKAMTIWSTHQHFEEATKGSIEVGKLADFVVLSDSPMTADPERLAELKVLETIKEGANVYRAA